MQPSPVADIGYADDRGRTSLWWPLAPDAELRGLAFLEMCVNFHLVTQSFTSMKKYSEKVFVCELPALLEANPYLSFDTMDYLKASMSTTSETSATRSSR
jgi:hypothetical protein